MKTEIYQKDEYQKLIPFLKNKEVVGFPTDTVYGLAVIYHDPDAFQKLASVKQRPFTKPISMMVSDLKQIQEIAYVDRRAEKIIRAFMPGALTVVLPSKEQLPFHVTLGQKTIGIRIPTNETALHLLKAIQTPLLVSSANLAGLPALMSADDVIRTFSGKIAALIAEDAQQTIASTVVDLTQNQIRILREGPITRQQIENVIKED